MSSEHESTRTVLWWLREPARVDAERVVARVLGEVELIPQRRALGPVRRYLPMNNIAKAGIAAAAVLAIAVAGYNLLPSSGIGGPNPTPSPALPVLARGTFTVPDDNATELEARGSFQAGETRTDVIGTLIVTDEGNRITVDLDCARSESGILAIGGTVAESTVADFPEGSLFAIILQQGSPARAGFMFGPTLDGPCMTFLLGAFGVEATAGLMPIQGTVELGP